MPHHTDDLLTVPPDCKVVILGTGGTIAGRSVAADDPVAYVAGQVAVRDLVAGVPALAQWPLALEQVAQVDSKDMGLPVWQRLVRAVESHMAQPSVAGIVITHGTDTLEETAYLLQRLLQPAKPVVLTCAMRPATALVPDGPQNLLDAVVVAADAQARGVLAVCDGQIHRAEHVAKVHSYRLDAFSSGDAGPVGCVEAGQVRWFQPLALPEAPDTRLLAAFLAAPALPKVPLLTSHADADGDLVRALLTLAPEGLLVAGTGNGTLHQSLVAALLEAQHAGVRVVRASRCAQGRAMPDDRNPFPVAASINAPKARLALALDLLAERSGR